MKSFSRIGTVAGPTVAIIGGTHGNEICGVKLIEYLRETLNIVRGKIIFLYGNPKAIQQGVRQVEMNLNRAFLPDNLLSGQQKNTYEYRRSRELMQELNNCDYSLDIHSSPTAGSPPMVICEENAFKIASYLPLTLRCSGFDTIEPGSTEYFMNSIGKIGLGIECGNHHDPEAFERAKESVYALLSYLDMIDVPKKQYIQKLFYARGKYLTKTTDFQISRFYPDFDPIKCGECIGMDGGEGVYAENDGYILFARNRNEIGVEGFVELSSQE